MEASRIALLGNNKGLIGILGTGSNLGYFDGDNLVFPTPSLGYILGDEGSGNAIGKQLLKDYFYGDMSREIASKLDWEDDVEKHLQSIRPNAFLASKVLEFIDFHETDYFVNLISKEFAKYLVLHKRTIQKYGGEIHFVGSIAVHFKETLSRTLKEHGMQLGKVIDAPIKYLS